MDFNSHVNFSFPVFLAMIRFAKKSNYTNTNHDVPKPLTMKMENEPIHVVNVSLNVSLNTP